MGIKKYGEIKKPYLLSVTDTSLLIQVYIGLFSSRYKLKGKLSSILIINKIWGYIAITYSDFKVHNSYTLNKKH